MQQSYTIEIDAPPERVFYWLDSPERTKQWLPNLVEEEPLEVKAGKVGTTFRQVYLENGRRMEMLGTVTAYEPNRRLACDIRGSAFDLFVDYRLEPLGHRTRLTQHSAIRFKGLMRIVGALMKPIMKKASTKQLDASFGRLRALAEAG